MSFLALLTVVSALQAQPSAAEILRGLDMTSFRNSTGPNRVAGWRRPADWSFSKAAAEEWQATLERPGDWIVGLEILRKVPEGVVVCFHDRAQNGGTYAAQKALLIARDDLGGYRVEDQDITDADCPALPDEG